jgi:hypothetical protein
LFLDTAIEEKGDMSVFFGFGNMALRDTLLAKPFRKNYGKW